MEIINCSPDEGVILIIFFRFFALRLGLNYLKHEESRRAADPLVFVKENVATFLDAVDTLKSILIYCNQFKCIELIIHCTV